MIQISTQAHQKQSSSPNIKHLDWKQNLELIVE